MTTMDSDKHFERMAGGAGKGDATIIVPAATVTLLRDADDGLEVLMLRKNSKIAFGGMWVFPGGRVDDDDGHPDDDMEVRARVAAVREAHEEAEVVLDPAELVWFSHWTPPTVEIRRFSTWFYAARFPGEHHQIDHGEITESQWLRPADALSKQAAKEIELAPPTWVTLHYMRAHADVASALAGLGTGDPYHYVTKAAKGDDGLVVMWEGDAGYDTGDASVPGPRHRLAITSAGYHFDDSGL